MAEAKKFELKWENYKEQSAAYWPSIGQHILGQYNKECIVVYQAFCPEIADYAVKNGKFGGMRYSFTRMTWIKTNFLWMMYRSSWAQKKNQNRILAIYLSIEGFDQILKFSRGNGIRPQGRTPGNVRIQWDPDHDPKGVNQRRRAVQLGIKGIPLERFHEQYIQHIEDITEMVKIQRQHVLKNELHKLLTPAERVYTPSDESICRHILLDTFNTHKKGAKSAADDDSFEDNEIPVTDQVTSDLLKEDKACTKPVFTGDKIDLIVCLGGSFNPIHEGHIQLLDSAIKWFENNANYNVVAARLAVAPDSHVEKKCKRTGDMCIKAEHRLKLCELACKGHKLIKTHYKTTQSDINCGENVKKWENFYNAKVAVVIGADKAAFNNGPWRWKTNCKGLTICVGRQGQTEAVRKAYAEDSKEDLVTNPDFILIEDEIDNINSTEIRQKLRETENDLNCVNNKQKGETGSKENNICNKMNDKTVDIEKRILPSHGDEKTVSETESMTLKEDKSDTKASYICNLVDEENVPLTWEELETEDIIPDDLEGDELKSNQTLREDIDSKCVSDNKDLDQEKYGARLKTNHSTTVKSTETFDISQYNKDIMSSRKDVIENFVSTGWLAKPVGEYMSENFSDLFH